jgi:hypothetical protein
MTFTPVWPDPDPAIREAVKVFWARLAVLPAGMDADERAAQLCVVGHVGGSLAAVSSVELRVLETLRQRLAMVRWFVAPEHRSVPAILALARAAHGHLEAWSLAHPEEQVMGMGAIIENPALLNLRGPPTWPMRAGDSPTSGLMLMGFTDQGQQIRVSWFNHATIGPPAAP